MSTIKVKHVVPHDEDRVHIYRSPQLDTFMGGVYQGEWQPGGHVYTLNDMVYSITKDRIYKCVVPHTSGDIIDPDISAGRWVEIALDSSSGLELHVNNYNNPHQVTKAQIGLADVPNLSLATRAEAIEGTRNDMFMTPLRVRESLGGHLTNTSNPHQVTKAQVGLSDVMNYPMATRDEALAGTRNDRYMSPLRVAQIIGTLGAGFSGHENNYNNPHQVTKFQIGLGQVEDYAVATQEDAEEGTSNFNYMTPLRTKQAVDVHASRRDNPHQVTASQLGLGSVNNWGIATTAQAQAGTHNASYMTPLRTREALQSYTYTQAVIDQKIASAAAASGHSIRFTSGSSASTTGWTNVPGGLNSNQNHFYVYPPEGYTTSHLRAFIPSIRYIAFQGVVNQDDILICAHTVESANNRIKVHVQNTEQRAAPQANWLAIWER